jgi:large subunit ribosomal protein L18
MALTSLQHQNFLRRKHRTRVKLAVHQDRPRLSVHRSLRHISAQIIDDTKGITLVSASDLTVETKGTKSESAAAVGTKIAELAKKAGITAVRFDRGAFSYHGRIAALAEAARTAGLEF